MPENLSRKRTDEMHAVDWKDAIATFAGPCDGNRKAWLARAARLAGVSFRQIRSLWYGEIKDPRHSVATGVLGAMERAKCETARGQNVEAANHLRAYAERLSSTDEEFYREEINRVLNAADLLCRMDRA